MKIEAVSVLFTTLASAPGIVDTKYLSTDGNKLGREGGRETSIR